jgi:DNA-directed RNA polymerase specialized sigma24 family protein
MVKAPAMASNRRSLMGQAELPPSVLFGETELDLWPYRSRTMALLRRYLRASIEIGRLPSLLGREFFRSRVTSYSMRNFEDTMVFVTDMEHTLDELNALEKRLLTMYVLEEYTSSEISRLLFCSERTADRLFHDSVDQLSRLLLARKLLEKMPDLAEASRAAYPRTQ